MKSQRLPRVALAVLLGGIYSTLYVARMISNALRDAGVLRLTVGAAFGLAALAVIALMARRPELRTPRTLVVTLVTAGVYALIVWPMSSPEEKLHFIEYDAVGVLAFLSMPLRWSTLGRAGGAAAFTLAAGWLDEGIQAALPNRYYDLRDVGFNALAGALAIAAFVLVRSSVASPRE